MIASIGIISFSVKAQDTGKTNSDQIKTQQQIDPQKRMNDQKQMNNNPINQTPTDMNTGNMEPDHIAMQNGKMIAVMDGKIIPMDQEVTMKNGTKCMTDGTCTLMNGKKVLLKNGDMMDMNGVMLPKDRTPKKAN